MVAKHKWMSAEDTLVQALEHSAGSLNDAEHGRLVKTGRGGVWDLDTPWSGYELTGCKATKSNWVKGWTVRFYHRGPLTPGTGTFTLTLSGELTREEVQQIGETYVVFLNIRRVVD